MVPREAVLMLLRCYCCWAAAAAAWKPPCWRDCVVNECARHCTAECCPTGKAGAWLGLHVATSYGSTPGAWLLAAEPPLGEEEEGQGQSWSEESAAIQVQVGKIYLFLSLTLFERDWTLNCIRLCCPAGSWENVLLFLGTVIANSKKSWVSSEDVPFSEFEKAKAITISLIILANELETTTGNSQSLACHSVCTQYCLQGSWSPSHLLCAMP